MRCIVQKACYRPIALQQDFGSLPLLVGNRGYLPVQFAVRPMGSTRAFRLAGYVEFGPYGTRLRFKELL